MMERVFLTIYLFSSRVMISLDVQKVPIDYDSKDCYLCSDLYKNKVVKIHDEFRGWWDVKYKKKGDDLFTCSKCVWTNYHIMEEWRPYFI